MNAYRERVLHQSPEKEKQCKVFRWHKLECFALSSWSFDVLRYDISIDHG